MGAKAIPSGNKKFLSLLDKLTSDDFRERAQALKELEENYPGWRNKKETKLKSSQLRKMLLNHENLPSDVLFTIIKALGYIRDQESIPILKKLLKLYDNPEILRACIFSIFEIEDSPDINLIKKFLFIAYPATIYAIERLYKARKISSEEISTIFLEHLNEAKTSERIGSLLEMMLYIFERAQSNFITHPLLEKLFDIYSSTGNPRTKLLMLRIISRLSPKTDVNSLIKNLHFKVIDE